MANDLYTKFKELVEATKNNAITIGTIFKLTTDLMAKKKSSMMEKDGPLGMVASQIRMEEPIQSDLNPKPTFTKHVIQESPGGIFVIMTKFEPKDVPIKTFNINLPLQESLQLLTEVRDPVSTTLYDKNMKKLFQHIDTLIDFSFEYLIKERNTNLLEYILQCSENFFLFRFETIPGIHSKVTWALENNYTVPNELFVLHKIRRGQDISDFFDRLLRSFTNITDSTTVLGEVSFKLSNCPSPNAIILMSKYYLRLVRQCKHRSEHRTSLKQKITTIAPSQVQTIPPNNLYMCGNIFLNFTETSNTPIVSRVDLDYLMVNPQVQAVVVPLYENCRKRKPSLVYFDFMVPTGVRLQDNCHVNVPRYQMETFFETFGGTQTLSLADVKPFIQNLFKSRKTLVLNESVVHHALYDKSPVGFSCNNDLIGKTFMFYQYRNDENTKSRKAKKRKNPSSSSSVPVCNTLHQNKYVLQNYYMSKDLIVSNIVNLLHNREHVLEKFKSKIQVKNLMSTEEDIEVNRLRYEDSSKADANEDDTEGADEDAEENRLRTHDRPITERQRNKYIMGHVSNYAFTYQKSFVNELVKAVWVGDIKRAYTWDDVEEVALFVLVVQNKHLALFDGELLKFINPGFGVLWIKPVIVDTDPIIVCRPCAYGNVVGGVESSLNKMSNNPHCTLEQKSFPFSYSNRCGSIVAPNANINQWISYATNIAIDPTNKEQADGALNRIKELKRFPEFVDTQLTEHFDGWWPVICPPDLSKAMFESANTPVGRLATHYSSKEEFSKEFKNECKNDIRFTRVFTANLVFSDVYTNINTLILYPPDVLNDPDCPLNKYLTYNELAASSYHRMVDQNQNHSLTASDPAGQNVEVGREHLVSKLIGSALPKTCWTRPELYWNWKADTTGFYNNEKVIIEEESFLIKGIDAFENL